MRHNLVYIAQQKSLFTPHCWKNAERRESIEGGQSLSPWRPIRHSTDHRACEISISGRRPLPGWL